MVAASSTSSNHFQVARSRYWPNNDRSSNSSGPSFLTAVHPLRTLAPVRAIRGNNDKGAWACDLPKSDVVELGSHAIYVLHNLAELDLDPAAAGFTVVVSGHSHKPAIEERGKILFVNPGSAGPRRFSLPVTLAILGLRSGRCTARIVELAVARSKQVQLTGESREGTHFGPRKNSR